MGKRELDYNLLDEIMKGLKEAFVSEADFQFYLAWKLKEKLSDNYEIMLEYPIQHDGEKWHIDIAIKKGDEIHFIELKYKTIASTITRYEQEVTLAQQSAQDMGRYWFIRDIARMESHITNKKLKNKENFCIFLTNDQGYWNNSTEGKETLDSDFRLGDERTLNKQTYKWNPTEEQQNKEEKKRWWEKYAPIKLNENHKLSWTKAPIEAKKTYQKGPRSKEFQYLLLAVKPQTNITSK